MTIPHEIESTLIKYIQGIKKKIPVEKVLLFGSYAKGLSSKHSDIDIAIFSSHFDHQDEIESFRYLFLEAMEYKMDLQPQAFTMQDYRSPNGIVEEIIKTGIEITG